MAAHQCELRKHFWLELENFNNKVQKKSYDEKGCTPAQNAKRFSNGKSQ